MTQFTDLGLSKPLLQALTAKGYDAPTPIQAQAIPSVLAGRDLLGMAQTGSGKTAAFALPILQRLSGERRRTPRCCRVLVLAPTRELASQIAESFRTYGKHMGTSVAVVYGGVKYGAQTKALANGVDVLVATPGRLLDLVQRRTLDLSRTEVLVLDEVDQMLDLGFIVPIRRVVTMLPKQRQNLFFSATMPKEIEKLSAELLTDPVRVAVTPVASTVDKVSQKVIFVDGGAKRDVLADLFSDPDFSRVLVFTRTKRGADKVAKYLEDAGAPAAAIHGDKSQGQRERALASFKAGHVRALVATDIAARGLHVDDVTHVVNFELPNVAEAYVHRIGRTARAGKSGVAITLCAPDERGMLRDIEKLTRLDLGAGPGGGESRRQAPRQQQQRKPQRQHERQPQGQARSQPTSQPERTGEVADFRQLAKRLRGPDSPAAQGPKKRSRNGRRFKGSNSGGPTRARA